MTSSAIDPAIAREVFLLRVQEIVSRIEYRPEYEIEVAIDKADRNGRVFLQVLHTRPDAMTGRVGQGKGGKRYLSPHMTESEVVRVAFAACLAYEEHEVREFFRWTPGSGMPARAVFGPHIGVAALYTSADQLDVRP